MTLPAHPTEHRPASPTRVDRYDDEIAKEPVDPRTPFQHDRDRLLYAPEFRRLAAVTQVAASHETLLFHNRLTHTLKVAQLARRIAERLDAPGTNIDPDVAEAAALAHDIGHPPFGHIAEAHLDKRLTERYKLLDGFEGNAQSFRIITRLSTRTSGELGLNLTRATLQAVAKYPWRREAAGKHHRKFNVYAPDNAIFEWSREGLTPAHRASQTPEAAVMDWSDDVAYALHDLEDFYIAGLVPLDKLAQDEREQVRFLERTRDRWQRQGRELDDAEWHAHEDTADTLFREFPARQEPTHLMRKLVAAKANIYAGGLSVSDGMIVEDQAMRRQLDLLKSLTWTYVIESPGLATQQAGQRRIVDALLDYYVTVATDAPSVLPHWAARLAHEDGGTRPVRLACDIVASLSESQARAIFGRITGATPGSILDSLQS